MRDINPKAMKSRREAAGITLAYLAVRIGCSEPALSRAERGLSKPRGPFLKAWARELDRAERRVAP